MQLAPGQIWQEVDPRFQRFIRIERIHQETAVGSVVIRTVQKFEGLWHVKQGSRLSYTNSDRFNGKRGGFAFVTGPIDR